MFGTTTDDDFARRFVRVIDEIDGEPDRRKTGGWAVGDQGHATNTPSSKDRGQLGVYPICSCLVLASEAPDVRQT